ncbi:MAG: sel1 repeat family protein [Proteobacteria bacterium]|nr:sel1 repeat family protein [Pseudomonadota bacterium]
MSKTSVRSLFLAAFAVFILSCTVAFAVEKKEPELSGAAVSQAAEIFDPEKQYEQGKAADVQELALEWYCQAARQGHGKSQYEIGLFYMKSPDIVKGKEGGRRNIAAAMMWLDVAIINKIREAVELRKELGKRAQPADFALYSSFTRRETNAPCTWAEIYEGKEEGDETVMLHDGTPVDDGMIEIDENESLDIE